MSKTVYKYTLVPYGVTQIKTHGKAKILSVQTQRNEICLWLLVDPINPIERRIFETYPTGVPLYYKSLAYVGTVQLNNGDDVLHVFEAK